MIRPTFALIGILMAAGSAQAAVSVRILLGVTDTASTVWDGDVSARGARITAVEPWRFDENDAILPGDRWRMSSRPARAFTGSERSKAAGPRVGPMAPNGVLIQLADEAESSELEVRTPKGRFTFKLSDVPYGTRKNYLQGAAHVERVPAWTRITNSADEQDYPVAAADRSGAVWVAYAEFRHNPDHNNIRNATNQFDLMDAKTGGDQILVKRFANGQWGDPVPVTDPGGDLYRPAIAIDGQGRTWVFWSANQNGDFDLWGRAMENGKPGPMIRISKAPGSDIDAVAATDSSGRVIVAWQGWRNGKATIFAVTQNGTSFSAPVTVSSSSGNEWNPAIAADKSGRVTVAWDSYRNGNYDIFFRVRNPQGAWMNEAAAAASPTYEASPSIAYDPSGTLWIAYEEAAEQWGKDFGADESTGVPLYHGRAIRLRGFTSAGAAVESATDPGTVMLGATSPQTDSPSRQAALTEWLKPLSEAAKKRAPNAGTPMPQAPKNQTPRLTIDESGRMWLAYRTSTPNTWVPLGYVWTEYLVSYSGSEWTGSIYTHHSDNMGDNRPALISIKPGELLIVHSADGRRQFAPLRVSNVYSLPREITTDPYQNDLYASRVVMGPGMTAVVKPAKPAQGSTLRESDRKERAAVAVTRAYRMKSPAGNLKVLRGEFHRHSELSYDSLNDGTLIDQYRYAIDASYMDWIGCCDHDNGAGREYTWWISQKLTDIFRSSTFVPMFSYERSVGYPEGHRNIIFAQRGIRPLTRLPITKPDDAGRAPDTQMLYGYLRKFNGIVASHTSGTNMGTDWRDNDPDTEPLVEIYQGDRQNYEMPGAPRSNSDKDSIGGYRPKGFINLALERGYKLAFEASSDHISTHMSYTNILATDNSREAILKAVQQRHVYGATDHILADYRSGDHIMGDSFSTSKPPELRVKLSGTAPFAKVSIIKNNRYVYVAEPGKAQVEFTWRDAMPDKGEISYYYVRAEQQDGEIVWASPMWITYTGK